jgi:hypothetical protein
MMGCDVRLMEGQTSPVAGRGPLAARFHRDTPPKIMDTWAVVLWDVMR